MANEKRLIDTEAVIRKLRKANCAECDNYNAVRCRACWVDDVVSLLEDSHTVDAVEVVYGRWEKSNIKQEKFCCSVCGGACWYYDYDGEVAKSRYCPNCGAKMDGGNKDG